MNEHEVHIAKILCDLAVFMARNSTTYSEKNGAQSALDTLSDQLVMIVGRRIIKESKK